MGTHQILAQLVCWVPKVKIPRSDALDKLHKNRLNVVTWRNLTVFWDGVITYLQDRKTNEKVRRCSVYILMFFSIYLDYMLQICVLERLSHRKRNVYVWHRQALYNHCIVLLVKQHTVGKPQTLWMVDVIEEWMEEVEFKRVTKEGEWRDDNDLTQNSEDRKTEGFFMSEWWISGKWL